MEKKFWKKNVGKENFKKKILITNVDNNINKCDTIFALLAPLDKNWEKDGVMKKSAAYALGIDSKYAMSGSHCAQIMWLFRQSREKRYITACELSVTRLPHSSGICFIDDREILLQGLPLRCSVKQLVPKKVERCTFPY